MKIKILASASRDLIEGYHFYEMQADGVGAYFLDSLHFGKYHRLLSKRFPFAVYYRVEGQTALVYAVLDCRRRPAWIRKKLN